MSKIRDSFGRYIKGIKHGSLSEETKKRMSLAQTGRKFSIEHKQKLSETHKGKPSPNKGKHPSEETIKKMRESHLGQVTRMKQKQNIFIRADNFIGKHRIIFILVMLAWVIGMFTGSWATTLGIQQRYWEKSGYYYIEPTSDDIYFGNTTGDYNALITYTTPDYSETAYVKAAPQVNKTKIIIFECFNSTLIINNNQILCQR